MNDGGSSAVDRVAGVFIAIVKDQDNDQVWMVSDSREYRIRWCRKDQLKE